MSLTVLATKFYIPDIGPNLVPRPRLTSKLNAGLHRKLTLVSAPAGFGKTTLVGEWLRTLSLPYTWLTLDEGDNDPGRFLAYFCAACQKVDATIGQTALDLMGASPSSPMTSLIELIINDITNSAQPFVVVLDEYDVIHAPAVHAAMELLLARQPRQLLLVLITRHDPPLPIPKMRVRNQLVEINEEDLRFTRNEAGDFLNLHLTRDLDADLIAKLEEHTEGWAAGLQLAALSMHNLSEDQVKGFVERFGGSHRHVIDYLTEEVLAQHHDIRDFLCQTSILDRFSAALCDTVTGRRDSKNLLKKLEQANLFLIRLDDDRTWYRYHRLFADFLRTELDADAETQLHEKAAHWLAGQGLLAEAIDHAILSKNTEITQQMIAVAVPQAIRTGAFETVQAWLNALPPEKVVGHFELATFQGFLLFFQGQITQAATYLAAAERACPPEINVTGYGRFLSLSAHLALCTDAYQDAIAFSRQALVTLDQDDTLFRNLTLNLLGQVLESQGDVRGAAEVYYEAIQSSSQIDSEVGMIVVVTNLVFALNELGRRREAISVCEQVSHRGVSRSGQDSILAVGVNLAWSLLSYEANELEKARDQVNQALHLAEHTSFTEGILWGRFILGRVMTALGDHNSARLIAAQGLQDSADIESAEFKRGWFAALQAQLDLYAGKSAATLAWVKDSGYSVSDTPNHWIEFAYFVYVRVLMTQNLFKDAVFLLKTMEESAVQRGRQRKLITIQLLQAICSGKTGKTDEALIGIAQAIRMAESERYIRAFLDEGQVIINLLPQVRYVAPQFVDEILAAVAGDAGGTSISVPTVVEPISEREVEILRLIAAGHSNPEIAKALFLSTNTVKWHTKNIYGKLGVSNRVEAVSRARDLQLL